MSEQELQAIKERADKPLISTLDKPMKYRAESRQDITKLLVEVERLREALEFYADEKTYETDVTSQWEPVTLIDSDNGKRARQALEGEK